MKKVFAIAFLGGIIITSCAKKEVNEESNVMLPEPTVSTVDSTSVTSAAATQDSTTAKMPVTPADSTSAK